MDIEKKKTEDAGVGKTDVVNHGSGGSIRTRPQGHAFTARPSRDNRRTATFAPGNNAANAKSTAPGSPSTDGHSNRPSFGDHHKNPGNGKSHLSSERRSSAPLPHTPEAPKTPIAPPVTPIAPSYTSPRTDGFSGGIASPLSRRDFLTIGDNSQPEVTLPEDANILETPEVLRPMKPALKEEGEETVTVAGISFKENGKSYFFAPGDFKLICHQHVIVETARGPEYGEVRFPAREVPLSAISQPLRPVLRYATDEDARHNEENHRREAEAFTICLQKIALHGLDMKLVEVQYTFDNSKLLFYFTSSGRVDFRELVKDLASVFRTRIELRQIGIRDEARMIGGLGPCGRPLCCTSFLSDFTQVSIKMAKEQNISLNSNKISGCCGRLMCCLRYEYDVYAAESEKTPSVGSTVRTPDGVGMVTEADPLGGTVRVRLSESTDNTPVLYPRDQVEILRRARIENTPEDNRRE